jgi:hypothetical protein
MIKYPVEKIEENKDMINILINHYGWIKCEKCSNNNYIVYHDPKEKHEEKCGNH